MYLTATISGADPGDFAITQQHLHIECRLELHAMDVTYSPQASGIRSGSCYR